MDTLTSIFSQSQNKMANDHDDISIQIQNKVGIFGLFMFIAVHQRSLQICFGQFLQMFINI